MFDRPYLIYSFEVDSLSFDTVVWVLNHSDTRGADRLVLVALASHQNGRGSRPAVSRLVEETLLGRRSVFRALANLEEAKAVEVVRPDPGRGKTNLYYVRTEKVTQCHQLCCKGDRVAPGGVPLSPEKVPLSPEKGVTAPPELLKSNYELLKARVSSGHPFQKPDRVAPIREEPFNPFGAGAPIVGDPCPACGERYGVGHRCEPA